MMNERDTRNFRVMREKLQNVIDVRVQEEKTLQI